MHVTKRLLFAFMAMVLLAPALLALNPYGVVIGPPTEWFLEPDNNNQGKWPHYHIKVQAPDGVYDCVINMDTRVGVQILHRIVPLSWISSNFSGLFSRANGFYQFPVKQDANAPTGGALDFLRMTDVWNLTRTAPWLTDQLVDTAPNPDTVPKFDQMMVGARKVYIFGEKFVNGGNVKGLHCVHQNQGNTCPSDYDNGMWQDGGVIVEYDPIRLRFPGICRPLFPYGLICTNGFDIWVPNRKLLMTRFVAQSDFTTTTGCAAATTVVNANPAANAGLWVHYGPYNTEQIEAKLTVTAGNFDLYIRKTAQPDDSNYDLRSSGAGLAQEFGWMYGAGQYFVSVKANGANSTGTLKITRKN